MPADVYTEHAPPPDLRPFVRALWRIERHSDGEHTIVPDGVTDLIVVGGHAFAAGVDTRPTTARRRAGDRILGIRLQPGAVPHVLGVRADELLDDRAALEDLWGADGRAFAEDPLGVLRRRLNRRPDERIPLAAHGLERGRSVRDVADEIGWAERTLRRRFTEAVGYGPKTFARVMRFQRALARIRAGAPLADVAFDAGYADQAHLTREVSQLAGATPGALRA